MSIGVVRIVSMGLIAMVLVCAPTVASAQQNPDSPQALREQIDKLRADFEALQKEYRDRLSALEAALGAVQSPQGPAAQAPAAQTPQTPAALATPGGQETIPGVSQPGAGASKVFNPDMAVIGNFVGAAGRNTVAPEPAMQMREAEASFQAIVDPYARADFFMSFGESGVDLEEGYITFPAIPGGLLVKVGKMRAAFGKVNTFHSHIMTWVDRPLVTTNLLAGEDGINDAGFSVARLIPNRWIFLEATGQVYRGD